MRKNLAELKDGLIIPKIGNRRLIISADRPEIHQRNTSESSVKSTRKTLWKTPGKIIKLLKTNPALSIPELAEKMERSESAIERAVRKLHQNGFLKRVGPAKGGHWEVVK